MCKWNVKSTKILLNLLPCDVVATTICIICLEGSWMRNSFEIMNYSCHSMTMTCSATTMLDRRLYVFIDLEKDHYGIWFSIQGATIGTILIIDDSISYAPQQQKCITRHPRNDLSLTYIFNEHSSVLLFTYHSFTFGVEFWRRKGLGVLSSRDCKYPMYNTGSGTNENSGIESLSKGQVYSLPAILMGPLKWWLLLVGMWGNEYKRWLLLGGKN